MKNKIKILSTIILTLSVIFAMCACSNEPTEEPQPKTEGIDAIFEIDDGILGYTEKLNHKNVISNTLIKTTDSKVVKQKNIAILGKNQSINYDSTVFYPVGNLKVNKYLVSGTEKNYVYLNEDGTINMILYTFTSLDILPEESSDVISRLLKEELKDIVDISKYQYMKVSGDNKIEGDHIGMLDFVYYNLQDGYMADFMRVTVTAEGDVMGFSIDDVGVDVSNVTIDKALADELLTAKLKDMYDTETTAYKSHHMTYTPLFRVYDDELCVEYDVGVEYEYHGNTVSSFIERILIPVRLISATNAD